jgi:hypothetical protein
VTKHEGAVFAAEMHTSTLAITKELAVLARLFLFHPLSVTVIHKAVLPYLPKVIRINVTLVELAPNTGASRYTTINQDRGYTHARSTMEEMVAYLHLIIRHKTLA